MKETGIQLLRAKKTARFLYSHYAKFYLTCILSVSDVIMEKGLLLSHISEFQSFYALEFLIVPYS